MRARDGLVVDFKREFGYLFGPKFLSTSAFYFFLSNKIVSTCVSLRVSRSTASRCELCMIPSTLCWEARTGCSTAACEKMTASTATVSFKCSGLLAFRVKVQCGDGVTEPLIVHQFSIPSSIPLII